MKTSYKNKQISNDNDKDIIKLILAGDSGQFKNIHKKYYSLIYSIAKKITHESDDNIDDIIQNIFIKIYTSLKLYNPEYLFFSWTYKITTNVCLDYVKRKKLTRNIEFRIDDDTAWDNREFDAASDISYLPDNALTKLETSQQLYKALDTLSDKYKQVIVLRYFAELDYINIAKYLDVPLGTVKTTLHRGKKLLENELRKQTQSISDLF